MPATISELNSKPQIQISQSICSEPSFLTIGDSKNKNSSFPFNPINVIGLIDISVYYSLSCANPNNISRNGFTESVTHPSPNSFLLNKSNEIGNVYKILGFANEEVLKIADNIIRECLSQNKLDIKISRTGDDELLIYRESNGIFNNIIIDSEGDIEFMHIPKNRTLTYNENYLLAEINTNSLVAKL